MRRQSDLGPLLAIALGALMSVVATDALMDATRGRFRPIDVDVRLARTRAALETAERGAPPWSPVACRAPFALRADPSDWAVVGSYAAVAHLGPKGLSVELEGVTLAADRDAALRGIVVGLAQENEHGGWFVSHTAEPIAGGALERGVPRPIRPARVLVPGVTPADLTNGWLVLEHVLDAPDAEGGTAWTYLHAPPTALHPLLAGGCEP